MKEIIELFKKKMASGNLISVEQITVKCVHVQTLIDEYIKMQNQEEMATQALLDTKPDEILAQFNDYLNEIEYYRDMIFNLNKSGVLVKLYKDRDTETEVDKILDDVSHLL